MRTTLLLGAGLLVSLLGTGCATKKYVAKTMAPVERRVSDAEAKNAEQDKTIADRGAQLDSIDTDLSKTKEKLTDVDTKATRAGEAAAQAGEAAKAADQKAGTAQQAADSARQAADGARTFAEQGLNRVQAMNRFNMAQSESILFGFDQATLTVEGKAQLDAIGNRVKGMDRYILEVQGFTDKSGSSAYNETLSERRAQAVARYLANQFEIPVHNISMLGSGYARPVADDNTIDGRKMNRRVEVRLWVPETEPSKVATSGAGQ